MINASEPTDSSFEYFINYYRENKKVKIFSDAVLNCSTQPHNFYTAISWFIQSENYYAERDWAKKILTELCTADKKFCLKKFDCLLGQQKPNRDFVSLKLMSSNLQDQFVYTYFKENITDGDWPFPITGGATTQEYCIDGLQHVPISSVIPVDIYNQTMYSIVAETSYFNEWSQFTEKTAKPLLAQRPFVAFCGQYFLRNLKSLGFRTFGDVIDESYDTVKDPVERWHLAWQQVEQLCAVSPEYVFDKLSSTLEHNQRHFLITNWHQSVTNCLSEIGQF